MDLILGLILLVVGLIAVVKGRFDFSRNAEVVGWPARAAGALLVLALPLAFVVQLVLSALQRGGVQLIPGGYDGVVTYFVLAACLAIAVLIARKGKVTYGESAGGSTLSLR